MRTKARNRWERAVQVLRWLEHDFKLPAQPFIEIADEIDGDESFGEVKVRGDRLAVRLSRRLCRSTHAAVETTIHEAAHLKLYRRGIGHFHGPEYWKTYGEMMDAFNNYGFQDSRAYSVD